MLVGKMQGCCYYKLILGGHWPGKYGNVWQIQQSGIIK